MPSPTLRCGVAAGTGAERAGPYLLSRLAGRSGGGPAQDSLFLKDDWVRPFSHQTPDYRSVPGSGKGTHLRSQATAYRVRLTKKLVVEFAKRYNLNPLVSYDACDDHRYYHHRTKEVIEGRVTRKNMNLIDGFNPTWQNFMWTCEIASSPTVSPQRQLTGTVNWGPI